MKSFALRSSFHYRHDLLTFQNHAIWATITTAADIESQMTTYVNLFPDLIFARDEQGRLVSSTAHPSNGDIIRSLVLWHGRYQLLESRPEHISATCAVFKATDELDVNSSGEKTHLCVALKLFGVEKHFNRELKAREHDLSGDYIVESIRHHVPVSSIEEKHLDDKALLLGKPEAEKLYCLVMPLADRNLFVAVSFDRNEFDLLI